MAATYDRALSASKGSAAPGDGSCGANLTDTFSGTEAVGFYGWGIPPGVGMVPSFSEVVFEAAWVGTDLRATGTELCGVEVVLEPATLMALSAGALALVGRRRKA